MKFVLVSLVLVIFVGNVFAQTPQTRIEERRASVSARREEMRTRLQAVRDEKKLQLLERIEEKFAQINRRRTDHFLKVLDRLREILAKIQSRADRAEANGKNVSGVDAAIAKATAAIDAAEAAVNTQAENVYEITVSQESTVRNDVGVLMKKLQEDLRATRDWVQKARTAVFDSVQALVRVVGNADRNL